MKHLRTYESRVFIDFDGPNSKNCPVCNNVSDIYDSRGVEKHYRYYHQCDVCKFKWYSEHFEDKYGFAQFKGRYMLDNIEIEVGDVIPDNLYSEVDIEANRYNL